MAASAPEISFWDYWLTDPKVIGALAWAALLLTVFGLGVAIYQSWKARTAAEAAQQATNELTTTVFARERLLELNSANALVGSAKEYITQRNFAHALIFLDLALQECARVRELIVGADQDRIFLLILRFKSFARIYLSPNQGRSVKPCLHL